MDKIKEWYDYNRRRIQKFEDENIEYSDNEVDFNKNDDDKEINGEEEYKDDK